jgi:hypothetical protein
MRLGVWLWLPVALVFSGCQGDYPLEPTPCDRYCHATQGLSCFFYDPAQCVLDCESHGGAEEACSAELDATSTCFEQTPGALEEYCRFDYSTGNASTLGCRGEADAYAICRSMHAVYE